jgi:hypothetical protein
MKPINKVRVRPGWRLSPDGQRPRVGRPDGDGREWPGDYLFHDVVNPGPDRDKDGNDLGAPTEFVFVDREEEVIDCTAIRRYIKDGVIVVVDKNHELFELNGPSPDAPKKSTPKKDKD